VDDRIAGNPPDGSEKHVTDLINELRAQHRQRILDERQASGEGPMKTWRLEFEVERRVHLRTSCLEVPALQSWQDSMERDCDVCDEEGWEGCDEVADADGYDFLSEDDIPY